MMMMTFRDTSTFSMFRIIYSEVFSVPWHYESRCNPLRCCIHAFFSLVGDNPAW